MNAVRHQHLAFRFTQGNELVELLSAKDIKNRELAYYSQYKKAFLIML